jgi:leader peptidase (prepilin peptidase) / N-methyltransferase
VASDGIAQGGSVAGWWMTLLAAPFVGSFLGVLIRRLPHEQPDLWGRSACEACGHRLGPLELLPLASFIAQRGRCRACDARIAPAHLAVEVAAIAVAGMAAATGATGTELWAGCALGWTLLALAWIDWEQFWLPDVLTLPLLTGGLLVAWLAAPWSQTDRAIGAIAGYLAFRLLSLVYLALRRREGLGAGDAKLLAAAGAWLGWAALPSLVLVAAVFGLGLALLARLRGATLTAATALPFGPALAGATWLLWLIQAWQG